MEINDNKYKANPNRFPGILMKTLIIGSTINCLPGSGILAGEDTSSVNERPNILFLISDNMNDWIGCLGGHPDAITPNIDRLTKRSVLFEQAQCSAPICCPSRASLLSGLNPSTTLGLLKNINHIRY